MNINTTSVKFKIVLIGIITLLYGTFFFDGNLVNIHHIGCIIAIFGGAFLYKIKNYRLNKNEFFILSILLSLSVFVIIQCFLLNDPYLIKKIGGIWLNVLLAFFIGKVIGFRIFSSGLRWCTFINLILIFYVTYYGDITQSVVNNYQTEYFITYGIFNFPILYNSDGLEMFRCGGLFGHPNAFGLLATVGMIGLFYDNTGNKNKICYLLLYIVIFLITQSRASLLFLSIFYIIKRCLIDNKNISSVLINIILLSIIVTGCMSLATLRDDSANADITSGRTSLISEAYATYEKFDIVRQSIGVGMGEMGNFLYKETGRVIPLDNSYIVILCDMGILGGSMFLALLLIIFYRAYSVRCSKLFISFTAGLLVYSMFEDVLVIKAGSVIWMVMLFSELQTQSR